MAGSLGNNGRKLRKQWPEVKETMAGSLGNNGRKFANFTFSRDFTKIPKVDPQTKIYKYIFTT